MSRANRQRRVDNRDQAFARAVERGVGPVVVRRPAMAPEVADELCEMGDRALDASEMELLTGAVQSLAARRGLPPVAAMAMGAAGSVVNRVMLALRPEVERVAAAIGCEVDQVPIAALPELGQRVWNALFPPPPVGERERPADPDEPIELRAARSGLVIAS